MKMSQQIGVEMKLPKFHVLTGFILYITIIESRVRIIIRFVELMHSYK